MDRMARGLRRVLGDDTPLKPTRPKAPPRLPEAAPAAPVYRGPGRAGPLRLSPAVRESLKPRHRGPHKASTIDAVRGLIETTTLSYRAIAARTGVAIGTIARHVRRGGWLRPETGFPEEHYTPEGCRRGAARPSPNTCWPARKPRSTGCPSIPMPAPTP